jgi:hypothetical protein
MIYTKNYKLYIINFSAKTITDTAIDLMHQKGFSVFKLSMEIDRSKTV